MEVYMSIFMTVNYHKNVNSHLMIEHMSYSVFYFVIYNTS